MQFGEFEVPTWLIGSILVFFVASFAYGVLIMQSLAVPLAAWNYIFWVGLILFVVYLFYRFVVAVETIATKL